MRGILTFQCGEQAPQQVPTKSHKYTLEIPQEGREYPKMVHCMATVWKVGDTEFVVSKLQITATGNMVLHIMGLYSVLAANKHEVAV